MRPRVLIGAVVVLAAMIVSGLVIASSYETSEELTGTSAADVLRGSGGRDILRGLGGADRLLGQGGNDRLVGGPGRDVLVGGPGRDTLLGGPGNDVIRARDGARDSISCGSGTDRVVSDRRDRVSRDCAPAPVTPPESIAAGSIVRENASWSCLGPVDVDLVKVTMRGPVEDAVRIDQNCTGRIGRIEIDTWTADGIKVQNRGTVAHDLIIESGYVKCHDVAGDYHQDGIQAMGGYRLTFRNVAIDCLGNANLFIAKGGIEASTPTEVVCENCILGPNTAQTLFNADSLRSGARATTVCTGRHRAVRTDPGASEPVDVGNTILPVGDPACASVTGR